MSEKLVSKITHLSHKGFGVTKDVNGKAYLVKGAWPGDECELEIIQKQSEKEHFGLAKIKKLVKPSLDRIKSPCPYLGVGEGQCGGCPWMIANYHSQLDQKEKKISFVLEKFGLPVEDILFHPIVPSPKILGYRNRAQFKTDGKNLGYVSEGTNTIASIDDCIILNDHNRKLLHSLRCKLPNPDWKPKIGNPWLTIDVNDDIEFENISLNKRLPFKQGNTEQNANMRSWLNEKLCLHDPEEEVLELFCGDGNFTELLAEYKFKKILAVEVDDTAIKNLQDKNLCNTKALNIDLFSRDAWTIISKSLPQASLLILDPPRMGFKNKSKFFEFFSNLKTIYYISCDIDSFTHDAKSFLKKGWKLEEVQPFDLFPHTPHIELIALFKK